MDSYLNSIQTKFGPTKYIKEVKSGKEATVHLLNVNGQLMALKIYKENVKFSSRNEYFDMGEIGDKRLIRAAKKKSNAGVKVVNNLWVNREYSVLQQLYECNAYVPKPIMSLHSATLMEYFGDEINPAPRLIDVKLTEEEKVYVYYTIMDHIELFRDLGFVHGDLSAYNILWHDNRPIIIDFPQVIYRENRNFREKYQKDVDNINKFFKV